MIELKLPMSGVIALIGLHIFVCQVHGLASQVKEPSSFRETEGELKSQEPCLGCNKELNSMRSQFHLQMIKERIQAVLGIDSDELGNNSTKLPSSMLTQVEEIFRDKNQEPQETKIEKQVLLPEKGFSSLTTRMRSLTFKIPFGISPGTVAKLWLPQNFLHFRITMKTILKGKTVQMMSEILSRRNLTVAFKPDGWVIVSLKENLDNYMRKRTGTIFGLFGGLILVEVSYYQLGDRGQGTTLKPFLVLEMARKKPKRVRRGIECFAGVKSTCCREKLTVDFAAIGLSKHIIEPKRFEAYQCVGTCGSFSQSARSRVDIVKSVMSNMRMKNKNTDHMKFCCTAARSSAQKLIYFNNEQTEIEARTVEGLVVEECECLY